MARRALLFALGLALVAFQVTGIVGPGPSVSYAAAAPISLDYYKQAKIDWQQFKGTQLTIGLNKHPFTESLLPLLPAFEQLTGMRVAYVILPEEEYFEKLLVDLASGAGIFDVYMTSPMFEWRYYKAGWIEDLNKFFNNPKLTDKTWYNREDFFKSALDPNMWDGTVGGGMGKGAWNAVPVMIEHFNTAYRKDLAAKYGIKMPPASYPELYTAVKAAKDLSKGQTIGTVQRGIKSWSTVHSAYFTAVSSYGGRDFDAQMNSQINKPEVVQITDLWAKMLRDAGPPGWPSYTWYDMMESFASGKFFETSDCDFFGPASYENPATSQVVGKVGYRLPPKGPTGLVASNVWTWALGMNSKSKHKEAAWLFIQWATASRTMAISTIAYRNYNPTRKSIWENPDVVKNSGAIDGGNYRKVVDAMYAQYGRIRWTPNPEVTSTGDIWAAALHDVYSQRATAEKALNEAVVKIAEFLKRAGLKQ